LPLSVYMSARPPCSTRFPYTTLFRSTAGIRETTDQIESIGVQRAYGKIRQSAIVLYLFDPREIPPDRLGGILDDIRSHMSKPEKDRKSTRLNSSHVKISYAVFCLKKK